MSQVHFVNLFEVGDRVRFTSAIKNDDIDLFPYITKEMTKYSGREGVIISLDQWKEQNLEYYKNSVSSFKKMEEEKDVNFGYQIDYYNYIVQFDGGTLIPFCVGSWMLELVEHQKVAKEIGIPKIKKETATISIQYKGEKYSLDTICDNKVDFDSLICGINNLVEEHEINYENRALIDYKLRIFEKYGRAGLEMFDKIGYDSFIIYDGRFYLHDSSTGLIDTETDIYCDLNNTEILIDLKELIDLKGLIELTE